MKILALFNSTGGTGKTTLVYHLAWMFADLGLRVIAVDLDPQCNLTTAFLPDERLEELWSDDSGLHTITGAVRPLIEHAQAQTAAHIEDIEGIGLVPGDPVLAALEDQLGSAWSACLDVKAAVPTDALAKVTALHRVILRAAETRSADVVLLDLGPGVGALNRAALIGTDSAVVPLHADMFSVRSLRNLGPKLNELRRDWNLISVRNQSRLHTPLTTGHMEVIGYVVLQLPTYQGRILQAHSRWLHRLSAAYQEGVLGVRGAPKPVSEDPNLLATLKDYRSLMLLAQEAHKPIFALKPADGAIGAYGPAVADAYAAFERLARRIAERSGIEIC